jgi:hypothetical protein
METNLDDVIVKLKNYRYGVYSPRNGLSSALELMEQLSNYFLLFRDFASNKRVRKKLIGAYTTSKEMNVNVAELNRGMAKRAIRRGTAFDHFIYEARRHFK